MNFQRKVIIFFIVMLISFFTIRQFIVFHHNLDAIEDKSHQKNSTNLELVLNLQKKAVEAMALQLSLDPTIIDSYKQNSPKILIDHLISFWNAVKSKGLIYEIHFFQPPAKSFVNFSNFKSLGKDVSSVRSDISWATSSFSSSSHLMMCKTYAGIRATFPILDENKVILGGLSLGKKVDWIPSTMKTLSGHESFLIYTKESAKRLASKYYDEFIKDKKLFGSYILANSTIEVPTEILQELDFKYPHHKITLNDKDYILNFYPLRDFDQNTMAYVAVLEDLSSFYDDFYTGLLLDVVILLSLAIITAFIIRYNISSIIRRINIITALTKKYKNKDFSSFKEMDVQSLEQTKGDEVVKLQSDVMQMGYELYQYYSVLEGQVAEKDQKVQVLSDELKELLYIDRMTGMFNRNSLTLDLNSLSVASVAIININNFKNINDLYGIEHGNILLVKVAKKIVSFAHEHQIKHVYALGGDETAILIEDSNPIDLHAFCLELVETLESTIFKLQDDHVDVRVDFSVGISNDKEYTLERADMALNDAKSHHSSVVVYQEKTGVLKQYKENLELYHKLHFAINNRGIILHYQPIVDLNGTVIKYESLVRMIDGDKVLSPFFFLDFAKKTKYYEQISQLVIEQSFEKFKDNKASFSINLTQTDILTSSIRKLILEKLDDANFRNRVIIELVESENIQDLDDIDTFITQVKDKGAQIAIDDFGSGYSNFSYLLKMQPDYLKIDGSLIKDIDTSENSFAIVTAIVRFAKELKIKTIAEYVHSQSIYDIVSELGIDEFQGFYFFEPKKELQT